MKRGFTLSELIISMSLLAMIAAAILLFVTTMSSFSRTNSVMLDRVREEEAIRKEFDRWFSAVDVEGVTFSINLGNDLVQANTGSWTYTVKRVDQTEEDGGILRFAYPKEVNEEGKFINETYVDVEIESVKSIYLAKKGDPENILPDYSDENEYTFPINLHIADFAFLCKVEF